MFSPNTSQRHQSPTEGTQSQRSFSSSQPSRRRPRPPHQSQQPTSGGLNAHPPKRPRQRSVSSQRQINESPEADAIVLSSQSGTQTPVTLSKTSERLSSAREWTKNEKYFVSQLTALPVELRDGKERDMVAFTEQTTGTALLLTRRGAYVWRYDDPHPLPKPDYFPLPSDEKPGADGIVPLALGALVSPSANSDEPGLVLVMPVSGRVAYWDAVGSAIAEGLFAKKRGVEGKVPLVTNEFVQSICNIEPAGFVLCLSSGRLAQLSLRDATGKPNIQVTPMKNFGGGGGVGSFLGGIASALKASGIKREIAALRPGRIVSGTGRELIVASTRGQLTVWEINKSGAAAITFDSDVRDQMLSQVIATGPPGLAARDREKFTVLDCIMASERSKTVPEVLVLTAFDGSDPDPSSMDTHYCLLVMSLSPDRPKVKSAHPITCYRRPSRSPDTKIKPRLYLPDPYRTAFVVFSSSVVIVSIIPEDRYDGMDESNSMVEDYDPTRGFEDVVDFKPGSRVEIIGAGVEDLTHDINLLKEGSSDLDRTKGSRKRFYCPSIIVVTKGAGVLRCGIFDAESGSFRPKPSLRPVPVKAKLEQAVFYGHDEKNLLNFAGRPEVKYPLEEIQTAAREISKEILSSQTRYLPGMLPSIESHLELRMQRLQTLAEHLRTIYPPLSRETKWKLCWDAEKLAGAISIYVAYDERLRSGSSSFQGVLKDAIISHLKMHNALNEQIDPIRDWFGRHVLSLWELLPHARVAYEGSQERDTASIVFRIEEGNELVLSALTTAFHFRINNAFLFGLENQIDDKGIPDFSGLSTAPWTSGPDILTMLGRQVEITDKLLDSPFSDTGNMEISESRIADQLVDLVETTCRNFVERATWCKKQSDATELKLGEDIEARYLNSRNAWIKALDKRDRSDRAIEIAEKYNDYRTLVELTFEELLKNDVYFEQHASEFPDKDAQNAAAEATRKSVFDKLHDYFQRFGKDFAFTLYEYQIEMENLKELLLQFPTFKQHLTDFLRSSPKYAKLSWINDVGMDDFLHAGQCLIDVANAESDLWCKTVEISLGKLACLVGQRSSDLTRQHQLFDLKIKYIDLQNDVYNYMYPELRGAIDLQAAVEIGMSAWARELSSRPVLREIFKRGLTRLISRQAVDVEDLIDVLTLKEQDNDSYQATASQNWPGEFCLALEALSLSTLEEPRRVLAERSIWRRCYLQDDWANIVKTEGRTDEAVQDAAMESSAFGLLKFGFAKGLFDTSSQFRPISPRDAFFKSSVGELKDRLPENTQHEIENLSVELDQENARLRSLLNEIALDPWFEGLCIEAKKWSEENKLSDENGRPQVFNSSRGLPTGGTYVDVDDMMDTD